MGLTFKPLPWRLLLFALPVVWLVGGLLFFASWRSSIEADRVRHAPTCSSAEADTSAPCQITLEGTVIKVTSGEVQLDIAGRRMSMPVSLHGPFSDGGLQAEVTFYRGQPIHAEGPGLKVDAEGTPAIRAANYQGFAIGISAVGTMLILLNLLISAISMYADRAIARSLPPTSQ